MKMKDVCTRTGLTDRAIRIYIEEGLVQPSYEENYNGRKKFDFSEEDVKLLNKISVLRKYDFSIKQIRTLINDENGVTQMLNAHIIEMKQDVNADVNTINSMINVYNEKPTQLDELCSMLSNPDIAGKPVINVTQPKENKRKAVPSVLKKIALIILATVGALVIMVTVLAILFGSKPYETDDSIAGFAIIQGDSGDSLPLGKDYHISYLTKQVLLLEINGDDIKINDVNNMYKDYSIQTLSDGEIKLNAVIYPPEKEYVLPVIIMKDEKNRLYIDFDNTTFWLESHNKNMYPFIFGTTKAKNCNFSYELSVDYSE